MFARQTFIAVQPAKVTEFRKSFEKEIIPEIKMQRGLVNVLLLEPTEKGDEFISLTLWETKTDADKYEKSGKYKELVTKLQPLFTKPTILKTFDIQKSFQ